MGALVRRMSAGIASRALRLVDEDGTTYLSEGAGLEKFHGVFGATGTVAGPNVDPESIQRLIAVNACLTLKVNAARTIPLLAFAETADGFKDYAKGRTSRYFGLVHDEPNPEQPADVLWATANGFLAARGNAVLWKERYGTGPRAGLVRYLWALDPRRVEVKRKNGRKVFLLHDRPGVRDPNPVELPPEDIIHIMAAPFSPDGLVGLSRIAQCREELAAHAGVREFLAHHIGNGANISGFISAEPLTENGRVKPITIDDGELERLDASLIRPLRGIRGSTHVPVITAPLKWNKVGMTLADQEFMDLMGFGVADIAMLMSVPPTLVNAPVRGSSLTYRTTAEEDQRFLKYGLNPELIAVETAVTRDPDLFRASGFMTEFRREAHAAMDTKTRYQTHVLSLRWRPPNEIRRVENLPPLPGGDVLMPAKAAERFLSFMADHANGNGTGQPAHA
jgi:HK97 family phage portal protein